MLCYNINLSAFVPHQRRECRERLTTEACSESSSGRLLQHPWLGAENNHRRPEWTHQEKTRAFSSIRRSLGCRPHTELKWFMQKATFWSRSSIGWMKFRLVVAVANMTRLRSVPCEVVQRSATIHLCRDTFENEPLLPYPKRDLQPQSKNLRVHVWASKNL